MSDTIIDASAGFSVIVLKNDEDKISEIGGNLLLGAQGEHGDRVQFSEYIQKNLNLYRLRNAKSLSTKGAASFLRGELAYSLRRAPYSTNILLGGYDEKKGASLYFIDYLAALQRIHYGVHGYGQYFCYGILDKGYKEDMTLDEAVVLLKKCIKEIQTRFVLNTPTFICKIVDKDGIRILDVKEKKES